MSHLILDIGNTKAKAAVVVDGAIVEQCTADDASLLGIERLCNSNDVDKVIACVVGCQPDFNQLIPLRLQHRFHRLSYQSKLPVTVDYMSPQTLGMDRVAAVVGARVLCPGDPLLVVDAGSCITVDFLDGDDVYRGGAILPGLHFRLRSLHDYTAALPMVTLSESERNGEAETPMTGKTTRESIVAGVCKASLFEIQGFIDAYRKDNPTLKLFLTGGDAEFFTKQLFFTNFATPSLVFIGLDKILEMNI